MINNNSDQKNQISSLQKGIVRYLNASQFASWNMLKKSTNSLFTTFYGEEKLLPDNLEYKVLYPLLRAGIIEAARQPETDKLVYCLGPHVIIETENKYAIEINPTENLCRKLDQMPIENYRINKVNQNDSLVLLKDIPSLQNIITHWQKSETEVHYIYERFEKNHFKTARDTSIPNIYTSRDRVYSNKYIRVEKGILYLIPEIEDNIDGFNIAHCYLEVIKGNSHFVFCESKKELTCRIFHSMLPVIVCRALILCDPMLLIDSRLDNNGMVMIKNVTNDYVKEIKRIFGEIAVEEK